MCVCHHDTPVPNENTSLRPSTLLRPSLPPRCLPASDHEDDSRNQCVTRLEVSIQALVRVNIHAPLYCLVGFRNMFASTPWRVQTGRRMLQTQRHLICFERMFTYSFNVFVSSSEDVASLEPTAPSCREDRFRHACFDHMGECAFSKAPCRCLLFAALPTNSLKHPHILEAMSAHETAQLLRKVVEFNTLISRLGDTLRGSSRRFH